MIWPLVFFFYVGSSSGFVQETWPAFFLPLGPSWPRAVTPVMLYNAVSQDWQLAIFRPVSPVMDRHRPLTEWTMVFVWTRSCRKKKKPTPRLQPFSCLLTWLIGYPSVETFRIANVSLGLFISQAALSRENGVRGAQLFVWFWNTFRQRIQTLIPSLKQL